MKTSFSTLACPDWSLPEILTAATNYGYDGVELRIVSCVLDLWKLPEFRPSSLSSTRALIEDHGLAVVSIGTSACFHFPDAEERLRDIDCALRMAEIAAGLGAPSIRVFGDRIQPGCDRTQTTRWIADSLAQLAEQLKPANVEVWLETHGDFASAEDVSEVFAQLECPQVGIIWDPANAFEQNEEAPLIPPQLSSRIRHVHVKDLTLVPQCSANFALTGEGDFPFHTMFASLAGINFDGFVSFEWEKYWHPELAAPEIALPHFIKWWKNTGKPNC
jgi:sugar phosphate isomerase/epimerase